MWFRKLQLYRLHDAPFATPETLQEVMTSHASRPLGGSEGTRLGWVAPGGRASRQLVHEIQGQRLFSALRQQRLLPPSVVREEVEERCADREAAEGRPLPRKDKQAIKEQVFEELLPRAFVQSQKIDLWWDTTRHLIGINTSSRARAEEVLDLLRQTLGSLKVTPLATRELPTRTMTAWLSMAEKRPDYIEVGDQVELKAQGDDGVIRARQVDLDSDEIHEHLEIGRQVSKMSICIDERLSLVLHDDLSLKSLRFSDALLDEASQNDDGDDAILRMEADFVLMATTLGEVIDLLIGGLGGEAEQVTSATGIPDIAADPDAGDCDPLYKDVASYVTESGKTSVSALQRQFKTGYNRACHLVEALEKSGIVSAMDNHGRRKLLAGGAA